MSDTLPRTSTDESALVNRLRTMYQSARRARNPRREQWIRNYRLLCNTSANAPSNSWIPRPRDSEIYPICSSIVGWMTDQTPNAEITPAADPNSPFHAFWASAAHDLELVVNSNNIVAQFDAQQKMVIWDALCFNMGVFKTCWDQTLDGGLGNARSLRTDPWTVYPDPNATNFDDMEYICEVRPMSLGEVYRRWPDKALAVEAAAMADVVEQHPRAGGLASQGRSLNPGPINSTTGVMGGAPFNTTSGGGIWGKRASNPSFVDNTTTIPVFEFWVRENDEWYDELPEPAIDPDEAPAMSRRHVQDYWRCVVVACNQVLMDCPATDLWAHGRHPYTRYVIEDIGEMYGVSLIDHLAQPQIYLNRLLTAVQQNAELIGNPIFLQSPASGLSRTNHVNRPGQILNVASAAAMQRDTRPDWLRPPEIPAYIQEQIKFWIQRMENISGISGMVKGATPTSRNSSQVVSSIQDAAFVRIRSALKQLEWSLRDCYTLQADLIVEFFDDRRMVAVLGPEGERASLVLHPRHFNVPDERDAGNLIPLKYSLVVEAGATRTTSRQGRREEAEKAYALGVIDEQAYLEAINYPNYRAVLDRVLKRKQEGTFNPPGARQKAGRKQ